MTANATDAQHAGPDLRRDRRFQVSQPAIITQPGYTEIACEIRDFCLGGLFLKFTNPEAAITALARRDNAAVEIVFTPVSISAAETFRVPAQLKRLSPLGVGVAFTQQPTEALRALQRLRMAGHRQKLAALPASTAYPHLREASTTLLSESLLQVHDQVMRQLTERLNAAALHAAGIAEHSGLLNAVHEFAHHAPAVQTRFVQAVLDALKQARPVQTQATRDTSGDLALVDELDFEDWLATSSEANRLEEHFREQLADIEPRIGQLFGFACDHSNNPFGPAVIGHAYRGALQDVPVLAKARQVAYATLRDVLAEQLAPLYAELLALLPVSEAEAAKYRPVVTPERSTPGSVHPAAVEATASVPPSAPPQGTLSRLAGSLMDFFRGQPASGQASASVAAGEGGRSLAPGGSGTPAWGGGLPGEATPGAAMPAGAPGGIRPDGGYTPGVAHSPVLQRLAAAGALPPAVTVEMQHSVDMFGALFDTMHAEKSISDGMRPFFQQLEASLIKLAMADPAFLSSPAHPAHKVLNTLDRISMVAGDDGKIADQRLLRLMNRWTDRINAEADRNPGVFEEARTQLERVVKPLLNERAARIFRLQEMCEGRQRAEVAKQRILRELLARLDERPIPNAVIELLNGGWRNVLLMAEIRHGSDSDEAREAWRVLEQLCVWLDPEHAGATTAEIQTLLQRIDQALTHVCADKFAQDRIVDQLASVLFDEDKSQHPRTPVAARLTDAATEPLTETQDTLAERLRVGDWLQFKSFDTPLNLIWIGDQPPVYVFANYRGIKKLDLKRTDLLQSLESGDAHWAEDLELPLMDRSYSAMIQKMQRDLVWQSSHDPATGLANRKSFFRAIRRAWLRSQAADGGYAVGVVQLDITTPAGEAVGAEIRTPILREYAQILPALLPPDALLARAGESGIAFWIEAAGQASAEAQADALLRAIAGQPQEINGIRYRVDAAAGLMWTRDCLTPEAYYDNANAACAGARESGARVVVYGSEADAGGVLALAEWAHRLTDILAHNQLSLNCQPVVAAADAARTALYHEVLLHPVTQGEASIATRDLIAVAERLQRVTEIDRWVVKSVLHWMRAHPERVATLGGFAINLSGQSVTNPLFLKLLLADLARGDLPGDKLIFEISEADAVGGHAQTQLFMRQLQRHGCRFTLDEFGAGTSSYTRLKSMKLDYLKIDRALVRELGTSMIDEALVRSILETGSFLGIKTVAGFVEDGETLAKLTEMGVDCVQGYLIGEPRPLETLV
ncbi:DUF1631 family protein [Thiobacillus sedimenti]|uniref:DUF1631 family protein n=1 Tax=Thiobacillus sedimenti TaxID=3110231 RepID=A0ABZ1CMR9_9PROT|nr:DUF1631 family protein [Thiobacillus sp. SCUT-2]WRS40697.1 DUF1631 family protein [Thiobacillus sp. SCUT-2]